MEFLCLSHIWRQLPCSVFCARALNRKGSHLRWSLLHWLRSLNVLNIKQVWLVRYWWWRGKLNRGVDRSVSSGFRKPLHKTFARRCRLWDDEHSMQWHSDDADSCSRRVLFMSMWPSGLHAREWDQSSKEGSGMLGTIRFIDSSSRNSHSGNFECTIWQLLIWSNSHLRITRNLHWLVFDRRK